MLARSAIPCFILCLLLYTESIVGSQAARRLSIILYIGLNCACAVCSAYMQDPIYLLGCIRIIVFLQAAFQHVLQCAAMLQFVPEKNIIQNVPLLHVSGGIWKSESEHAKRGKA